MWRSQRTGCCVLQPQTCAARFEGLTGWALSATTLCAGPDIACIVPEKGLYSAKGALTLDDTARPRRYSGHRLCRPDVLLLIMHTVWAMLGEQWVLF